jgi:ribosomal subunit interface protein
MRIQVSGKQIDIGEALQTHVGEALSEATAKYAGRPTDATVVFFRDGHDFCCEVTVHLSTGLTAQAKGAATEIYAAFDAARDRMAKQLRRHKRRLKDHHAGRTGPITAMAGRETVLAPYPDEDAAESVEDGRALAGEGLDDGLDGGLDGGPDDATSWAEGPAIIAETDLRVATLSVGEAVMQMELAHAPVLVFRHERQGRINVVYRREDGTVGWIDPRPDPDAAGAPRPSDRSPNRAPGG